MIDTGSSIRTAPSGDKSGIPLVSLGGTIAAVFRLGPDVVLHGAVAKLTAAGRSALNSTFNVTATAPTFTSKGGCAPL